MERSSSTSSTGSPRARIYGALALALVLIFRSTGIVNFAQGEMAMFTTFIAWGLFEGGRAARAGGPRHAGAVVRGRHGHRARAHPPRRGRRDADARDRHARPVHPPQQPGGLDLGLREPRLPEPVRRRRGRRSAACGSRSSRSASWPCCSASSACCSCSSSAPSSAWPCARWRSTPSRAALVGISRRAHADDRLGDRRACSARSPACSSRRACSST